MANGRLPMLGHHAYHLSDNGLWSDVAIFGLKPHEHRVVFPRLDLSPFIVPSVMAEF